LPHGTCTWVQPGAACADQTSQACSQTLATLSVVSGGKFGARVQQQPSGVIRVMGHAWVVMGHDPCMADRGRRLLVLQAMASSRRLGRGGVPSRGKWEGPSVNEPAEPAPAVHTWQAQPLVGRRCTPAQPPYPSDHRRRAPAPPYPSWRLGLAAGRRVTALGGAYIRRQGRRVTALGGTYADNAPVSGKTSTAGATTLLRSAQPRDSVRSGGAHSPVPSGGGCGHRSRRPRRRPRLRPPHLARSVVGKRAVNDGAMRRQPRK
jgi:hypothetical protein